MEWKKVKLGEVATYVTNKIKSNHIDLTEYVTTDSMLQNKCGREKAVNLPPKPCALTRFQKGDVLVANIRPYLKKLWLADCDGGCSTDVLVFRTKENHNSSFLYGLLMQDDFFNYVMKGAKGSKMPRGDKRQIMSFPVPALDFKTECHIASVLSALDRKIALNRAINKNLEAMAKQLYDYWFVQFDFPDESGRPYKSSGGEMVWNERLKREIPKGWEVERIGAVIEDVKRGISYSSRDIKSGNGIAMMNLACFDKQGEYRAGEMKFYSGDYKDEDRVFPSELLIACTDLTRNADIIGTPILIPKEYEEYVFSTDLAKLTVKSVGKMYLFYALKSPSYRKYIKPWASGTNVLHLNIKGVQDYLLPIPEITLQKRFEKTIESLKEQQLSAMKQCIVLTTQRDTLLPLLMNGQVSVNSD